MISGKNVAKRGHMIISSVSLNCRNPCDFFRRFLLTFYVYNIKAGLALGLTRSDLSKMRLSKRYFTAPDRSNTLLVKFQIRLYFLKIFNLITFQSDKLSRYLSKVLYFYEINPKHQLNPSINVYEADLQKYGEYTFELHVIPSPYGFLWNTPRGLLLSLRNYLAFQHQHKIGHAFVVLKKNGKIMAATGMTGETNLQALRDIFLRRSGLEFLLKTYRGRLESSDYVIRDIRRHQKKNKIKKLKYDLSCEQYERCMAFINDWYEHGHYQNYGLTYDVDDKGASCTSFATSLLNRAGLLTQEQKENWVRVVSIPKSYFKYCHGHKNFFKIIPCLILSSGWKVKNDDFLTFRFWDPDLMFKWISEKNASS